MWRLRALLISDPLIIVSTIVLGTVSFFASFFDATGRTEHRIARFWARLLVRASGIRVRVEGLEKLAPGGYYVFVANHRSYMDTPVVLLALPFEIRFLAKRGLFSIPFLGSHLRRAGHIPVDLDEPRAAVRTLGEAGRTIHEKRVSLIIFPEGGRTEGKLEPFKEGAAYVAIKSGAPIVPLGLVGLREILPVHSLLPRPLEATVRIGDPIDTSGLKLSDRGALTARAREQIAELIGATVEQIV